MIGVSSIKLEKNYTQLNLNTIKNSPFDVKNTTFMQSISKPTF